MCEELNERMNEGMMECMYEVVHKVTHVTKILHCAAFFLCNKHLIVIPSSNN